MKNNVLVNVDFCCLNKQCYTVFKLRRCAPPWCLPAPMVQSRVLQTDPLNIIFNIWFLGPYRVFEMNW